MIYLQSKRGFDFVKKKYAEAHQDEIAAYVKAVKYLKANAIRASDQEKLLHELKNLEAQRTKLTDELEKQGIDPDLLGRIQYCIKTVMETGELPGHRKTIEEQLRGSAPQNPQDTQEQTRRGNPLAR